MNNKYRARYVVLALGRAGTPRKLGIKGEELGKVMYRLIEANHYTSKNILVVGGGDSAVEAAMGLAEQKGNKVTLSYRGDQFRRIKQRNEKRLAECIRAAKLQVHLKSNPVEFRPDTVLLESLGATKELPNDFIWIFIGGTTPSNLLERIGIQLGLRDPTVEAGINPRSEPSVSHRDEPFLQQ